MKARLFIWFFLSLTVLVNACASQAPTISEAFNDGRLDSTINLRAISEPTDGKNNATNVTVKKYVKCENDNFKIYYDIITPKVDEYFFVLALDSSGSFGYSSGGTRARQADAVIGAVPDFINDTIKIHSNKNFRLSIVSWDNDIDFAYTKGDFNNNDTNKVELVPISDVVEDIKKLSPFVVPDGEGIPYRCEEQDFTNLSQPVKASLEILNADINQPDDSHRVKRFIIIVTGEGEYIRYDPSLIENANDIPIYVVGMEFKENTKLWNHLVNEVCSDPDNFIYTLPNSERLRDDLLKALNSALGKAIWDPVATNVSIIEPIDRFFVPNENATVVIKTGSDKKTPIIGKKKNDTLIEFQFPNGLYPENVTELSFNTKLFLELPISEIDEFLPSRLAYTWFNEKDFNITVPKNKIRLESQPTSASSSDKAEKDAEKSEKANAVDGFGILQLFVSIAIWKYLKCSRL